MKYKELYHVTQHEYVKDILKNGLIAGVNRQAIYDDDIPGVYLTPDYECLMDIDCSFDWDKEHVILKVNIEGIEDTLQVDPAYDNGMDDYDDIEPISYYKLESIEASRITVHKKYKHREHRQFRMA